MTSNNDMTALPDRRVGVRRSANCSVMRGSERLMPTRRSRTARSTAGPRHWRDRKRYVWLLGIVIPILVPTSWAAVLLTGSGRFWWSGPALMLLIIPVLDYLVGPDSENPPDSVL